MSHAARSVGLVAAAMVLLAAGPAAAQRQPYEGQHEVSGHMGPAIGITETAPGGFKLANEYGYRFNQTVWLNAQLNFLLGGGSDCRTAPNNTVVCYGNRWGGDGLEMIAGVKLKFPRGRALPYAKIGGGFAFTWWHGDYGATAIVARGGGGFKYFVIPRLAVGGEAVLTLGPNIVRPSDSVYLYLALDIMGGVEFRF